MRKSKFQLNEAEFSLLTVDDDEMMTDTIKSYFQSFGYRVDIENDPVRAIERVRTGEYDIMLLDFLMRPICGDEVVRQVREFNKDLFIILLTGHKSMAPPIKTIRELDIQGYYEKNERFDELELLVESCIKSIRHMKTIRKYRDGLQTILNDIPLLYSFNDLSLLQNNILQQALFILQSTSGYIYLDVNNVVGEQIRGMHQSFFVGAGDYEQGKAETAQKAMKELANEHKIIKNAGFITAPLFTEGEDIIGIITVDTKNNVDAEAMLIFEMYTKQVVSVISNLLFKTLLSVKNDALESANRNLRINLMETVNAMRLIVEMRDVYTRGHSDRVSYYAVQICKELGMPEDFIERVRIAGLFHDIGKVGIPDNILLKNTRLTDDEFEIVQRHPTLGRKVLSAIKHFEGILDIIEDHHRFYNDGGYPRSRSAHPLSLETRIITAADSFDAMTSRRAYRDGMTVEAAMKELKRCSGHQFDPIVIDAFLRVLSNYDEIIKDILWTFEEVSDSFGGGTYEKIF